MAEFAKASFGGEDFDASIFPFADSLRGCEAGADNQMDIDSDDDDAGSSSTDGEEDQGGNFGNFLFTNPGQNVAFYYDDDFHLGSVTCVHSSELAEVNFLQKCSIPNTYVWPHKPDKAEIRCIFIFDTDFEITSATGRVWSVPQVQHDLISKRYHVYKERFGI